MRKTILLISHHSGTPGGPVEKLNTFLKEKNTVYIIEHPLFPRSDVQSFIDFGRTKKRFKLPWFLQYLTEALATSFYIQKYKPKKMYVDLVICFDPLSYIDYLFYKQIIPIKKAAYYNLDFSIKRFSNQFLNTIYRLFFKIAYKHCDYFFSLREQLIEYLDPQGKYAKKSFVMGQTTIIYSKRVKKIPNSLVYAGAIGNSINFIPLLHAIKKLQKNTVCILDLYGKENDNGKLRRAIKEMKLEKYVNIKSPIPMDMLSKQILPIYMIGVSPYMTIDMERAPDYLFQGKLLPAKVVDYIASGLPVIATKINPELEKIKTNKFGFLATSEDEWKQGISSLFSKKELYKTYQKNAFQYAKNFIPQNVFGPVFKKLL